MFPGAISQGCLEQDGRSAEGKTPDDHRCHRQHETRIPDRPRPARADHRNQAQESGGPQRMIDHRAHQDNPRHGGETEQRQANVQAQGRTPPSSGAA